LLCGFNVAIRGLTVEAPEFSHATQVKRLKKCIQYKSHSSGSSRFHFFLFWFSFQKKTQIRLEMSLVRFDKTQFGSDITVIY